MRDRIDEINRRAEIKSRIIKYWNVNYIDLETLQRQKEEACKLEAQKIVDRLETEKSEDEAKKQEEIDQAYLDAREAEKQWLEDNYNETTGAFSGIYGQNPTEDEIAQGRIDMILNEKNAALRKMIDEGKEH